MNNKQRVEQSIIKLSNMLNQYYGCKYTWNILTYKSSDKLVEGFCTEHKEKLQFTANSIYRGTVPCKKCRGTVDDSKSFIAKAIKIHGDKYSYDKVEYTKFHEPVVVTCSKHGDFEQRASDHLSGKGCNKCANNIQSNEEILIRFKEIHGNKYDYSKVNYVKMQSKVNIICPVHGEFSQNPSDHIFNLQGCPSCGSSCFSSQKPGTFYILKVFHNSIVYYKIGITNKTLKQRYSSRHDKNKINKCFLYTFNNGYLAQELENKLLCLFKNLKANTNMLLSGNTEILLSDIRKTNQFKELFNEQRKKDSHSL